MNWRRLENFFRSQKIDLVCVGHNGGMRWVPNTVLTPALLQAIQQLNPANVQDAIPLPEDACRDEYINLGQARTEVGVGRDGWSAYIRKSGVTVYYPPENRKHRLIRRDAMDEKFCFGALPAKEQAKRLSTEPPKPPTSPREPDLDYELHCSFTELAHELGVRRQTIAKYVKAADIPVYHPPSHPASKWVLKTDITQEFCEQIEAVRLLNVKRNASARNRQPASPHPLDPPKDDYWTITELREELGISRPTLRKYLKQAGIEAYIPHADPHVKWIAKKDVTDEFRVKVNVKPKPIVQEPVLKQRKPVKQHPLDPPREDYWNLSGLSRELKVDIHTLIAGLRREKIQPYIPHGNRKERWIAKSMVTDEFRAYYSVEAKNARRVAWWKEELEVGLQEASSDVSDVSNEREHDKTVVVPDSWVARCNKHAPQPRHLPAPLSFIKKIGGKVFYSAAKFAQLAGTGSFRTEAFFAELQHSYELAMSDNFHIGQLEIPKSELLIDENRQVFVSKDSYPSLKAVLQERISKSAERTVA